MIQLERIQQLEKIKKGTPLSNKKIVYDSKEEWMNAYEIPLDILMYNPYNGRIMSRVKTFEKQFKPIDINSEEDKLLIERFIWDSSPEYNKHTLDSLANYGQNEIGIITSDGIIIDGNRRACLLNTLNRRDGGNRKFLAVILPDALEGKRKEINALETLYQIGVDDKVDYNPIEKYLKCKDLTDDYSVPEIAVMMSEDDTIIQGYLSILELMEEYLRKYDYEKIYTRLAKREGHFVDLNNYLKSYSKTTRNQNVNWQYSQGDIQNLKDIYFDYIRLGIPVANARIIGRSKKNDSFFVFNGIWQEFKIAHFNLFKNYTELSLEEFRRIVGGEDINKVISVREEEWVGKFQLRLINNLEDFSRILNDQKSSTQPLELLKRAYNSLNQINAESLDHALIPQAKDLITSINEKLNQIEEKFPLVDSSNKLV